MAVQSINSPNHIDDKITNTYNKTVKLGQQFFFFKTKKKNSLL